MVMVILMAIWLLMFMISVVCLFIWMFSIGGFFNRADVSTVIIVSCFLTCFGLCVMSAIIEHDENELLKTKLEFCGKSFDNINECEETTIEGLKSEDEIIKLKAEKIYIKHIRKPSKPSIPYKLNEKN